MQDYSGFIFCGLLFSIILNIIFFSKKHIKTKETKIFSILLIVNLISLISEVICNYIGYNFIENSLISHITTKFYLICLMTFLLYMTLYIYILCYVTNKEPNMKYYNILKYISYIIWLICVTVCIILPITTGKGYATGTAVNWTYLCSTLTLIEWSIPFIKNFKTLNKKKILPMILFVVFMAIIATIQRVHPEITLTTVMEFMIIFIMYHTIENPDVKMINELEYAKSSAEKANKAKTEFLSNMSHEIRTPLNAIVGLSEIISTSDNIKEIHDDAKDVINASYTLLEIVNSILDISKIEAGKMEIVNVNYNPKEEINKLTKLLNTRIGSKDLKLITTISDDLPNTLNGDLNKVKQIMSNLLSNAIKYTEKGTIDFIVNVENVNDDCNLTIIVKDTGRGIKEEQLDHLFNKFERLETDKNTTIEGTGLGLAITKSLTDMLNGTIEVESVYGKGSTFTVRLKQKIIKDVVIEKETIEDTTKYNDVKALIVDDSNLNLKVADRILKEYNLETELVLSGEECLKKIKENNKYDIIFMDIMMPDMDGIETLKKLKELNEFNIPVVALTADAMEGKKDVYLKEGFVAYLTKPIQKHELEEILNNTLKEKVKVNLNEKKENAINTKYLEENGVDIKSALEMFGSMEIYIDSVKTYIHDSEENFKDLIKYFNENDLENYTILVHKLKSESRYLGLNKIADMALQHETKSKEKDLNYIKDNFDLLEKEYRKSIDILKTFINSIEM